VGRVNASAIELEEQGLQGTVSAYSAGGSQATFVLTVASDSVFATLTGNTTLTVFQQPATELLGLTTVGNGDVVRVRALLFLDAGTYKLVASRIMGP
jgi:hypothetical protein